MTYADPMQAAVGLFEELTGHRFGGLRPQPRRAPRRRAGKPAVVMPSAAEIARAVAAKLGPVVRAEFLTEANAEQATGQSFDWWVGVANRLCVPVLNPTGKKRLIDVEVLRRTLADSVPKSAAEQREDPIAQIHRLLNEKLNGGGHAS